MRKKDYMKGELVLMEKDKVVSICSEYLKVSKSSLEKYGKEMLIEKYLRERNKRMLWS